MATGKLPVAPSIEFLLSRYESLEDFEKGYPRSEPVDADLDVWEEYVESGLNILAGTADMEGECPCPETPCWCITDRLIDNGIDQEDADIGEEELDA